MLPRIVQYLLGFSFVLLILMNSRALVPSSRKYGVPRRIRMVVKSLVKLYQIRQMPKPSELGIAQTVGGQTNYKSEKIKNTYSYFFVMFPACQSDPSECHYSTSRKFSSLPNPATTLPRHDEVEIPDLGLCPSLHESLMGLSVELGPKKDPYSPCS